MYYIVAGRFKQYQTRTFQADTNVKISFFVVAVDIFTLHCDSEKSFYKYIVYCCLYLWMKMVLLYNNIHFIYDL